MTVKQFLKKFNFAVLPLVIWGIMILYHTLVCRFGWSLF